MRLFAVRLIKDKQAVGFFWAPDPISLWWMIDSVCDPGECEYRRIKERAAITWQSKIDAGLGVEAKSDEEAAECSSLEILRANLSFDYALEDYVLGEVGEWVKAPFADEVGGGIHDMFERRKNEKPMPHIKSRAKKGGVRKRKRK